MKSAILLFFVCIFYACTDHYGSHQTTSYVDNKSGHTIDFKFYREGKVDESQSKQFLIGERSVVCVSNEPGGPGLSYANLLSGVYDSSLVSFDKVKISIHYNYGVKGKNPDAYLFDNSRNLFNEKNYESKIVKDTKKSFEQEFIYTITGLDFLNAK